MDRIRQLSPSAIDEMEARKHDTEYQLALCQDIMNAGQMLPFPFHRAVILLSKERRHAEALRLCEFVKAWCDEQAAAWDGQSAMHWRSPKLIDCIGRIDKLKEGSAKSG